MSNCAIDWALSIKLDDPATKIVLFVLANRADNLGQCWPTHQSISEQADQSPRSVRRRLDELEQAKLIERKRRRRESTIYTLKMPGLRTANSVPPSGLRTATAGHSRNLRTAKLELRTATVGRQNPQYEPSLKKTLAQLTLGGRAQDQTDKNRKRPPRRKQERKTPLNSKRNSRNFGRQSQAGERTKPTQKPRHARNSLLRFAPELIRKKS